MASLKVVSDRCDDNAHKIAVVIPPRRNGEPNLGALTRVLDALHGIVPDAYDPVEVHHAAEAPMPPVFEEMIARGESDDPQVGSLKAGEAQS